MSIIDKIFLVKEIKSQKGELHFKRWSLVTRLLAPLFDKYLFNIYIHMINRADEDLDMHDHPWNFMSLIINGGYDELTPEKLTPRRPLSIAFKKGIDLHKVVKLYDKTYTLVITSRRNREWGYLTNNGWIDNITYRQLKKSGK